MSTVRLPGGPTLSYQEWGRPDGAVVLMLHGLGSTGSTWRHVGPVLGERFRVIAPDARGHGDSEWTPDYSFTAMSRDVVELMDQLGVLAAIVVGHSMGAITAYHLAATQPDRVRLLVLEEMPPPDPAQPPQSFPRQPTLDTDWRATIAVRRWRNAPDGSWWPMAKAISARTLVLGGTGSHLDQSRIQTLSDAIPNGTYRSLNLGHSPHDDRPSEFLGVVEPFLEWFAK